ncbi:hypothetical protein PINS_up004542 [Pythium insidiosum]|nr:hypothetical protein PINS_up004542 [Pythium insidiosum]
MIQNKNVFNQLNDLQLPPVRAAVAPRRDAGSDEEASSNQEAKTQSEFVPTEEWLLSWKKKLPLTTSLRLLQYLVPQVCGLALHELMGGLKADHFIDVRIA